MKFCLNSRVGSQYLKDADQIKVEYRDFKILTQLLEQYPDKEIIFFLTEIPDEEMMKSLRNYSKIFNNLILAFAYFPLNINCEGLRFYTTYPVESFSEAKALVAYGVEYLKIGCPLFFQMDEVKALNIPIRFTPNQSWLSIVPRENGVCGQWMRPEDVIMYDIIPGSVIEFDLCRVPEEEALFRIYKFEHKWGGPLSYLVHNLNNDAKNDYIAKDIASARLNCGHKCMTSSTCRICPNAFKLAKMAEDKKLFDKK